MIPVREINKGGGAVGEDRQFDLQRRKQIYSLKNKLT